MEKFSCHCGREVGEPGGCSDCRPSLRDIPSDWRVKDFADGWIDFPSEASAERQCTCHPDDAPVPCSRKFALGECLKVTTDLLRSEIIQLRSDIEWSETQRIQNFEWAVKAEKRASEAEADLVKANILGGGG